MNASELFSHWSSVRQDLYEALDKLTDEQLDFVPGDGLWSLGKVVRHIAEAEEDWFRYAITQELSEWPKFPDKDYATVESVKALLARVHARTQSYLATVDVAELARTVTTPWGSESSLGWIVWHVFEHELHHRGEIYLMLGLQGIEAPNI
jgi:uncharacterized damage-inducible protein DinB